jgi:hypothetical protein
MAWQYGRPRNGFSLGAVSWLFPCAWLNYNCIATPFARSRSPFSLGDFIALNVITGITRWANNLHDSLLFNKTTHPKQNPTSPFEKRLFVVSLIVV